MCHLGAITYRSSGCRGERLPPIAAALSQSGVRPGDISVVLVRDGWQDWRVLTDDEFDDLCRRLYRSLRDGTVNREAAFDLSADVLADDPSNVLAAETAAMAVANDADRVLLAAAARDLLAAVFEPGFDDELGLGRMADVSGPQPRRPRTRARWCGSLVVCLRQRARRCPDWPVAAASASMNPARCALISCLSRLCSEGFECDVSSPGIVLLGPGSPRRVRAAA
jgi:hypothetical protein